MTESEKQSGIEKKIVRTSIRMDGDLHRKLKKRVRAVEDTPQETSIDAEIQRAVREMLERESIGGEPLESGGSTHPVMIGRKSERSIEQPTGNIPSRWVELLASALRRADADPNVRGYLKIAEDVLAAAATHPGIHPAGISEQTESIGNTAQKATKSASPGRGNVARPRDRGKRDHREHQAG